MQVQSFIFQAPYPSAIQIGRPNPVTVQESEPSEALQQSNNQSIQDAKLTKIKQTSSVNVASSLSNSGVVEALNTFTDINALSEANKVYS